MNPLNSILVDGAFVIDNSSFEYITTCPRSAYYHIIRKRKSSDERPALNFGGAAHAGLEHRYRDVEGVRQLSDTLYNGMVGAALDYEKGHPLSNDDFRNSSRLAGLLAGYNKKYPSEPFKVAPYTNDKGVSDIAVEVPFSVPLGVIDEIPIIWTGKIDLLVEWENQYWVLDHKTTSILGPSYFEQFFLSHQMRGYCWAAEKLLDKPISGAIINVLGIRKETKTGKAEEFLRQRFMYTQDQLQEWQTNALHTIAQFFQQCKNEYWPQYNAWCVGKFGKCQYFDVCTLPERQREVMLNSGCYTDVTWSPLNKE